jgi:hypothetical protein
MTTFNFACSFIFASSSISHKKFLKLMACFPLLLPPHSRLAGTEEVKNYSFQILQARDINHQCHHHYQSVSLERWSEIAIYHRGKSAFRWSERFVWHVGETPSAASGSDRNFESLLNPLKGIYHRLLSRVLSLMASSVCLRLLKLDSFFTSNVSCFSSSNYIFIGFEKPATVAGGRRTRRGLSENSYLSSFAISSTKIPFCKLNFAFV